MFNIKEYEDKINDFFKIMSKNMNIVDIKLSDDKWTLKEMVAHLIDSASNNHQRFVRLQINNRVVFPNYDPEVWKNITKINEFNILDLIILWKNYNYLLLHLLKIIDANSLNNVWEINPKPETYGAERNELTLKFIIEDYFGKHMDWHIELYKNRIQEINGK
jgi:hypothetical protein